ncbi:MAG: hypothetical protein M0R75_06660 [Dehalococcoidia bacterium]|nr:hypothetical protein [Dehalococcoidia bacterium]
MLRWIAWPLLKVAESGPGARLAAAMARHAPGLLPVRRVALTEGAFAMIHPLPQYPDHVVVTPRTYVADLGALVEGGHAEALRDTLDLARWLDLERPPGGRLFTISNGDRLHVRHVHGHLVSRGDAFWLAEDAAFEVGEPRADDPEAVLAAVGDALARVGGSGTRGSLIFEELHAERLRVSITVAPPDIA